MGPCDGKFFKIFYILVHFHKKLEWNECFLNINQIFIIRPYG